MLNEFQFRWLSNLKLAKQEQCEIVNIHLTVLLSFLFKSLLFKICEMSLGALVFYLQRKVAQTIIILAPVSTEMLKGKIWLRLTIRCYGSQVVEKEHAV
jgi:hypothetical protein